MDQVVTLGGSDPEGDALRFRIMSLPATGALYQYENGNRGAIISAPGTLVTDAGQI